MSLIYSQDDAYSGPMNFDRIDATKAYLNHYQNLLTLSFIANNTKNRIEKADAMKEMEIAERKMKFWTRQARYDHQAALSGIAALKKQFNVTD